MKTRREKDALGYVNVPYDAYYGSETQRSLDNFQISDIPSSHVLIYFYALLKRSAATANLRAGKLDKKRAGAIVKAADEIMEGKIFDQFDIDVFQAGAGTCVNMNVNEVIANRAIELLGGKKGDYKIVHPNDHVNMSQSTNDTYPTAVDITLYWLVGKRLLPELAGLEKALLIKSKEFSRIVKIGRTHLQDAVPIKFGDEFAAYAEAVSKAIKEIQFAAYGLLEVPLGGTAIGTGINAGAKYTDYVRKELSKAIGVKLRRPKHLITDTQFRSEQLQLSDALDECAITLTKIANDFRLMGSGPVAGFNELIIPAAQPGSSIMPGKVNPSMAEMLNMVCIYVMGANHAVRTAVAGGQLELNVFMPVISYELISSIEFLSNAVETFSKKCVSGLKANEGKIRKNLEMNLELATALNQYIGYAKAAELANIARKENKSVKQVCIERKVLDRKTLDRILDPAAEARV